MIKKRYVGILIIAILSISMVSHDRNTEEYKSFQSQDDFTIYDNLNYINDKLEDEEDTKATNIVIPKVITENTEEATINKEREEIPNQVNNESEESNINETYTDPIQNNTLISNTNTNTNTNTTTTPTQNTIERFNVIELPNNHSYSYSSQVEQILMDKINKARVGKGLSELITNSNLCDSARYKSNSMLQYGYISNGNEQYGRKDKGGQSPEFLMKNVFGAMGSNYNEAIFSDLLVNFASVEDEADALFKDWFDFYGDDNILYNNNLKYVGVGVVVAPIAEWPNAYTYYVTTHFMT